MGPGLFRMVQEASKNARPHDLCHGRRCVLGRSQGLRPLLPLHFSFLPLLFSLPAPFLPRHPLLQIKTSVAFSCFCIKFTCANGGDTAEKGTDWTEQGSLGKQDRRGQGAHSIFGYNIPPCWLNSLMNRKHEFLLHAQLCPTLRPHGLQHIRLLCLWDFSGKNTGAGCRFLL